MVHTLTLFFFPKRALCHNEIEMVYYAEMSRATQFACFAFLMLEIFFPTECFCSACIWEAPVTNPHQVDDEKLFQDLFLSFNLHLSGFRPHHKRSKEHFFDKSLDKLQTVITQLATHVEQRNVERVELP